MLERLKRAYQSRRYGAENLGLVQRVERAVAGMPSEVATRAWRTWLWRLPPEAWLEAVDLRVLGGSDPREAAVRAMTRRSRAADGSPTAAQDVEAMKEDLRRRQGEILERRRNFAQRWGDPPK